MRTDKPYKAIDPKITINNIRNILTDNDIFLIEVYFNECFNSFSNRLIISSPGLTRLQKGSNGKGMSPEYSLASAYGEFMEYIQNYHLFDDILEYANKEYISNVNGTEYSTTILNKDLALDFSYDPDEKYFFYEELSQNQKNIFNHIAIFNEDANLAIKAKDKKKILFAPFYCVKEGYSEYLPISFIRSQSGSNGLCAGNTKEEAILHGICEIFERYVAKTIFLDEITPPTIPTTIFEGTKIFDLLSKIEKNDNVSIIIKDCSLNQGLPVIGLLVIDHDCNSYAFKLGADVSPIIALERCFTELFQGQNQLKQILKKADFTKDPFEHSYYSRIICKKIEFFWFIKNGSGKLPNSMFSSNFSYQFNGLNKNLNKSDKEDLRYLLRKIGELGFSTYVRDVSFLNFPSCYVYIPGMSEVVEPFMQNHKKENFGKIKKNNFSLLSNFKNYTVEEFVQIAEMIEEEPYQTISLFPYNVNENNYVNKHYLLALIYYRISNYLKSYENLNLVIDSLNDEEIKENIHLLCSRDYIYFKAQGYSKDEIIAKITSMYKVELLSDVTNDLENEIDVFQYQSFPTCFNCNDCEIKYDCHYFDVLGFLKNIQEKHRDNKINQDGLKWLSELM